MAVGYTSEVGVSGPPAALLKAKRTGGTDETRHHGIAASKEVRSSFNDFPNLLQIRIQASPAASALKGTHYTL